MGNCALALSKRLPNRVDKLSFSLPKCCRRIRTFHFTFCSVIKKHGIINFIANGPLMALAQANHGLNFI